MKPEQELTKALKMVCMALRDLNYTDHMILGLTNICLQGHITDTGEFTEQYQRLAAQALTERQNHNNDFINLPPLITKYQ